MKKHCISGAAVAALTISTVPFLNAESSNVEQKSVKKPNILFLFADDFCYEAIGALGLVNIHTPNLDKIMNNGVHFTNAYNMGSWTKVVCMASRTMLNSGLTVNNCQEGVKKHPGWAELMHDAGYKTYFSGKWHTKGLSTDDFDIALHVRPGMAKQTKEGYHRPRDEEDYKNGWKPWDKSKGGYWEGGTHWTKVLADDAVGFIDDAKKQDKPFFMYIASNAPHDPRQSPKEYVDMYPLDKIKVPKNFVTEYPYEYKKAMGCKGGLRDESLAPTPRTEFAIKVHRQEYYAAITYLDANIGRILDALEKSGMKDNTYIIFTADQGLAVGHHGLMGKQNMFESAMRVPFFISGPGIPKGETIDNYIYLQDVMPTVLELAGAKVPDWVEFKSVLPLIKDANVKHYDMVYGKYMDDKQRMLVKDGYKMIIYPLINKYILYNLNKDPDELVDLSENPEYAGRLAEMKKEFIELQKKMNDNLDLNNPSSDKHGNNDKKKGDKNKKNKKKDKKKKDHKDEKNDE